MKDGLCSWCSECMLQARREYLKNNLDRAAEVRYQYRHSNLQKFRDKTREWVKSNSEYKKEYGKKYRQSQDVKEKYKLYNQNHRRHKITDEEWILCKEFFDYSCAYCGISEFEAKKIFNQKLHKDHIDHNGLNDITNCVPACKGCNSEKWEHPFDYWYNESNSKFSVDRYEKIISWIEFIKTH
jgi:5-methylcytosine-specific restriction endonuclease McrA